MPAEGTLPEPNFQLLTRAMSGSQAGRRGHAVQRRGAVPGGGAAHDRIAGSAADARQAQCGAGICGSARSRSAGHAMSWTIACPRQCNCGWSRCRKSALRKGRSRCPRLRRGRLLAAADYTQHRHGGRGVADRRLVSGALDHRTVVPSDEVTRTCNWKIANSGPPNASSSSPPSRPRACPCEGGGSVRGHSTHPGTRRQTSDAGRQRVHRAGD